MRSVSRWHPLLPRQFSSTHFRLDRPGRKSWKTYLDGNLMHNQQTVILACVPPQLPNKHNVIFKPSYILNYMYALKDYQGQLILNWLLTPVATINYKNVEIMKMNKSAKIKKLNYNSHKIRHMESANRGRTEWGVFTAGKPEAIIT